MIIDNAERVIRYVELDESGVPCHVNFHTHTGRADEETWFAALVQAATDNGHTIVRLCNHAARCKNPKANEIEADGSGGIRATKNAPQALDKIHLWDAATMQRTFLTVPIEGTDHQMVVRMEPGEMKTDGAFFVDRAGVFSFRSNVAPGADPLEPSYKEPAHGAFR